MRRDHPPDLILLTSSFPRLAPGAVSGGGGFVERLARELSERFEVVVAFPDARAASRHGPAGPTLYAFAENPFGIPLSGAPGLVDNVRGAPWKLLLVPFLLFGFFLALRSLLRERPGARVQAHWLFPAGFVAACAWSFAPRRSRFPLALCSHGSDLDVLSRGPFRRLLSFTLARADVLACNNAEHLALARRLGFRGEGAVIPLGVDVDVFSPRAPDPDWSARLRGTRKGSVEAVFAFTGNLIPSKGVPELLEAFARVNAERGGALRLVLAGEGPCRRGRDEAMDARVGILWAGRLPHDELASLYASCDAFVFPSHHEGFGLAVAEALACGLPALLTPLPVFAAYAGLGLPPIRRVADARAIADALLAFLDGKDSYLARRDDYRAHVVERATWSGVAAAHARLLERRP